ncbi:MAG: anhydro-N-acetylmuramic acid kinase [Elusimicrobiales bacterium]
MSLNKYALGLMSGTSADGVSIAAVKTNPFAVAVAKTYPYPPKLQAEIIRAARLDVRGLSRLNFALGVIFAEKTALFLKEHGIRKSEVEVIGSHGQTVCHYPADNPPHTLQIGEPSFLAELGIPVVSDFRPRDMAAGGEGAPLVPFLDNYLFGSGRPKLLQNIGGIGNIAIAGRGVKTFGFDTGPGNCLMDDAARIATNGRLAYDRDGKLAAAGTADAEKAEKWLKMPFFRQKPPKSLDRAQFGPQFLSENFGALTRKNICNVMATLNYFTAASISLAAKRFMPGAGEMIVSGGGALNPVLMSNIGKLLSPVKVSRSSDYGLDELAKEPACFALMAHFAWNRRTNHCPAATGARHPRILGKITL